MSDYLQRIGRLQERLKAERDHGVVLAGTDQMRYLTGWREGGHERFVGLLVPASGDPTFLVPAMNAEQARTTPAGISQVVGWDDSAGWHDAARRIMASWQGEGAVFVDDEMHAVHLLSLQSLFPQLRFVPAGALMARMREVKTSEELVAMERAARLIDEVYEDVAEQLVAGITESQAADLILGAISLRGSRPSFSPLVCFGENAAQPHHHTGDRRLKCGDVVIIDIGCVANGYASDITRTIAYGEPGDADVRAIYAIVFQAHMAAREMAGPGVSGEAVDNAARGVIGTAGYAEQFLHRTGHGIGLSVHEPPNIVQGNRDPLKPGMCFSIEPGIYLSGRFGVRIENIVTVTDGGVRSLNREPDAVIRVIPAR